MLDECYSVQSTSSHSDLALTMIAKRVDVQPAKLRPVCSDLLRYPFRYADAKNSGEFVCVGNTQQFLHRCFVLAAEDRHDTTEAFTGRRQCYILRSRPRRCSTQSAFLYANRNNTRLIIKALLYRHPPRAASQSLQFTLLLSNTVNNLLVLNNNEFPGLGITRRCCL